MPNRLSESLSPYLQQHADNPVDWYPWGPAAWHRAREQDRPVLLSIGYAACHWCHVMAHESFEDPDIAAAINRSFVAVKVDREEHPAVDATYQAICQLATGQGGWPLTVFATPDLRPFYVGTYFPPRTRYGRPGFLEVVGAIAEAWQHDRGTLLEIAEEWTGAVRRTVGTSVRSRREGPTATITELAGALLGELDVVHGGFGDAPKFPHAEALDLLLRAGGHARQRACFTLRAMATGGIFDQIGGGFHRYSTDAAWRIPHFEKMLYDNALLPPVYLAAYQATGEADLGASATRTLDFLLRELRSPEGAFFSSLDADSLGPDGKPEEGAFYTWTPAAVREALGDAAQADLACRHFGITEAGNFEHGQSVPHLQALSLEDEGPIEPLRERLRLHREQRSRPGRDEKILCGWNGLALSAFAQAARICAREDYHRVATELGAFLLQRMSREGGGLWRRYRDGKAGIDGTLEDYAYLTSGLIDLYEATFDPRWLGAAMDLARQSVARFWVAEDAAFCLVEDAPDLLARVRDDGDSGLPAPQSVAVAALLRLAPFTADPDFAAIPAAVLERTGPLLARQPRGMASLLCALDRVEPLEVILGGPDTRMWLDHLRSRYLPRLVQSHVEVEIPGQAGPVPAWEGRHGADRATAWICRGGTCQLPAHTWADLEAAIAAAQA